MRDCCTGWRSRPLPDQSGTAGGRWRAVGTTNATGPHPHNMKRLLRLTGHRHNRPRQASIGSVSGRGPRAGQTSTSGVSRAAGRPCGTECKLLSSQCPPSCTYGFPEYLGRTLSFRTVLQLQCTLQPSCFFCARSVWRRRQRLRARFNSPCGTTEPKVYRPQKSSRVSIVLVCELDSPLAASTCF